MAALDREGMRNLVKDNLGLKDDSTYDSQINAWLNFSLRDLQRRHAWTDLEVETTVDTVDGTKTYSLDSSLSMITTLRISSYDSDDEVYSGSRPLILKSQSELDALMPKAEQHAEGKPIYAVWFAKQLSLAPIPDDAYVISYRYKKKITEFANDQAVSGILQVDDVLVARATWYAWLGLFEDQQNAGIWFGIYEMGLAGAILEDSKIPAWEPQAQPFGGQPAFLVSPDDPYYKMP